MHLRGGKVILLVGLRWLIEHSGMGALRLLPDSRGGGQDLLREGEVTDLEGDRQRIEGEFKDNLAQEEAGRQHLNSWGEDINKLGEANDKFNEVETIAMGAMFAGNMVILHENVQTGLLREC